MDLERLLGGTDTGQIARIVLWLAVIFVVTFAALRIAQALVNSVVRRALARPVPEGTSAHLNAIELEKRQRTLEALGGNLLRLVILTIAGLAVLGLFEVDIGPAIAGLGLLGLALGLGAQSLVKDIIAGAFILLENQYARGDVVRIADVTGTVEDLGLRRTLLRDFDGTVHVVPNGLIGVTSNLTRIWARVVVDIIVKDPTRVDEAMRIIDAVGAEMAADEAWRRRVLSPPHVDRIKEATGAGVTLKVVGRVGAADRWDVAGELRRRIVEAFAEREIQLGG
jgi:small conductance mechanosensitive channel